MLLSGKDALNGRDGRRSVTDATEADPTIDDAYVEDIQAIQQFLQETNRIQSPMEVLSYTNSAPLAAANPDIMKIDGQRVP